jgi:hypothetical protein
MVNVGVFLSVPLTFWELINSNSTISIVWMIAVWGSLFLHLLKVMRIMICYKDITCAGLFFVMKRRTDINAEIQILIDYGEGKKSINELRHELENNVALQELLKKKTKIKELEDYDYSFYNYIDRCYSHEEDWDTFLTRYNIQKSVIAYLDFLGYYCKSFEKYKKDVYEVVELIPEWLYGVDDKGVFDKIMALIPNDLPKEEKMALFEVKAKEFFKADNELPYWIQEAEWPIINGKPLVFSHQEEEVGYGERTFYYFYDAETKEETIITQFY